MKLQKALYQSYDGLLRQGKPAYDPEMENCHYLAADGCRCGIGQLIPPHLYKPNFENKSIDALLDPQYSCYSAALDDLLADKSRPHRTDYVEFYQNMQNIHDNASRLSSDDNFLLAIWRGYSDLANSYKLKFERPCPVT